MARDGNHEDDEEVEEEDDSEDKVVEEDKEEEEVVIESEEDDIHEEEFELQTGYIKSNTESDDYTENEEEEDYDEEEEDEEEEDAFDTEEEEEQEEEEKEDEECEEEEEAEEQDQGNESDEMGEEESEDLAEEENEDEDLPVTFVGNPNPNFLTLQKYRAQGHGRVCFTPNGGKSMLFNMCIEKESEVMRLLMKNPPEGTTWRMLRGDTAQDCGSQKPGRSCAPGFTTASDEDSNVKPGSVKVDDNTKRQERKLATKRDVNAHKASSKESTTVNPSSPKKTKKSPAKPTTMKNQKTAQATATQAKGSASFSAEEAVSKKPADPKQGETNVNNRIDSDDDSLDLGDVEGVRAEMAKLAQDTKPKKPLRISVSAALVNVADGCARYLVSFPPRGGVFYLKAGCLQGIILLAHKKRKLLNPNEDSSWIQSISSYNLRDKEFGDESRWLKTKNGNTIDVIYFIVSVPVDEANAFESTLKAQLKYFLDVTRKRKSTVIGRLVLDYCQDLRQGRKGGLGNYCLKKGTTKKGTSKEVVSDSKAVEVMTEEIQDHFKDGYTVNYDVPLNKFMVDWDIKEFLSTYIGVNSWDDLSEGDKRKCYRDYPKKSLP